MRLARFVNRRRSCKSESLARPDTRTTKRVLVLGGAGYLGSVLVRQLLRRKFRVRVLDAFWFGNHSLDHLKLHTSFDDIEIVRGDLRDAKLTAECMADCEGVIHLAAVVGDSACEEHRELAIEVNREATRELIQAARNCGVSRFIFASSCSVYGASDACLNEDSPLNPLSLYARTKTDSEGIVLGAASPGFCTTVFRLATLFGLSARMRLDLVVNAFVAQAVSTGHITVWNGEQWRPFLHVQDGAAAFVSCLEARPAAVNGQVFNVGSDRLNLQIGVIGQAIVSSIRHTRVNTIPTEDRRNYRVSFEKVRRALRFNPKRDIAFGIDEICDWMRRQTTEFSTEQFDNQRVMRQLQSSLNLSILPLRSNPPLMQEEQA